MKTVEFNPYADEGAFNQEWADGMAHYCASVCTTSKAMCYHAYQCGFDLGARRQEEKNQDKIKESSTEKIHIPTETMEQEFGWHYRRGVAAERERCIQAIHDECATWNRSQYVETVEKLATNIIARITFNTASGGEGGR